MAVHIDLMEPEQAQWEWTGFSNDQNDTLDEAKALCRPESEGETGPQYDAWICIATRVIWPCMQALQEAFSSKGDIIQITRNSSPEDPRFFELAITPNAGLWNRYSMTFRYLPLHDQIFVNTSQPFNEHRVLIPRRTTPDVISALLVDFIDRSVSLNSWNEV